MLFCLFVFFFPSMSILAAIWWRSWQREKNKRTWIATYVSWKWNQEKESVLSKSCLHKCNIFADCQLSLSTSLKLINEHCTPIHCNGIWSTISQKIFHFSKDGVWTPEKGFKWHKILLLFFLWLLEQRITYYFLCFLFLWWLRDG